MFTRIAKVFLWILSIAVVISAFAVSSVLEDSIWFFVILGAGFILLMFFGMFVELCNNVLDIKKMFAKDNYNSYSTYNTVTPNNAIGYSYNTAMPNNTINYSTGGMLEQAAKEVSEEKMNESQDGWFCRQCGTKNKALATFCSGCGKTK